MIWLLIYPTRLGFPTNASYLFSIPAKQILFRDISEG